jgi:hypothetical protein
LPKQRNLIEDDGRTVASMNVEGMPWYVPNQIQDERSRVTLMDKRQARQAIFGALGAGLTVVGVISLGIVLFVLFCTKVWFS